MLKIFSLIVFLLSSFSASAEYLLAESQGLQARAYVEGDELSWCQQNVDVKGVDFDGKTLNATETKQLAEKLSGLIASQCLSVKSIKVNDFVLSKEGEYWVHQSHELKLDISNEAEHKDTQPRESVQVEKVTTNSEKKEVNNSFISFFAQLIIITLLLFSLAVFSSIKLGNRIKKWSNGQIVAVYLLLILFTYVFPYIGSNSSAFYLTYSLLGYVYPITLLHISLYIAMTFLVLARLEGLKKALAILPVVAASFDMIPVINMIPLVPTFLNIATLLGVVFLYKAELTDTFSNNFVNNETSNFVKNHKFDDLKKQTEEDNKKKGDELEDAVEQYYTKLGCDVIMQGRNLGKSDGGVDLIVIDNRKNTVTFVQCKNYDKTKINGDLAHTIFSKMKTYFNTDFPFQHESIKKMMDEHKKVTPKYVLFVGKKAVIEDSFHPALNDLNHALKVELGIKFKAFSLERL